MIEQALILCGGRGTRLGEITRQIPKPMVPVDGKPFLEYLLTLLCRQKIRRFALCISYLADQIRDYFDDGRKFDCEIVYAFEKTPCGTGGAIKNAAPLLDDAFLVLNADTFLSFNYAHFIQSFRQKPNAVGMLACWSNEPPQFTRNVLLDEKTGRISGYDYKNSAGKNYVDVGVKAFTRKLFDYFPDTEVFSLEIDVMPHLAAGGVLYGYPVSHPPLDVGTHHGLQTTRQHFQQLNQKAGF